MLSEATIAELFASRDKRKQVKLLASKTKTSKGRALVRNSEGQLEWVLIEKMGDFDLGKHVGNVGTMRRSRKGASRRMPNGKRYYQPHDFDTNGTEVVAYKLK